MDDRDQDIVTRAAEAAAGALSTVERALVFVPSAAGAIARQVDQALAKLDELRLLDARPYLSDESISAGCGVAPRAAFRRSRKARRRRHG
jgi:hypothetical protein